MSGRTLPSIFDEDPGDTLDLEDCLPTLPRVEPLSPWASAAPYSGPTHHTHVHVTEPDHFGDWTP